MREILRLTLVGTGMAVAVSCNTVLGSMFRLASAGQIAVGVLIAGALMLVIGLCYVELFSLYPGSLALRAFTRAVLGDRWSLGLSLLYIALVLGLGAFEARLCFEVLHAWLPASIAGACVCAVVIAILAVNLRGGELSVSVQMATSASMLLLLWALSLAFGAASNRAPSLPLTPHALAAIPTALFLFVGIEWACLHAKGPGSFRRHLAPAVGLSVLLLVSVYAPFALALGSSLDRQTLIKAQLPHLALTQGHAIAWHAAVAVSLLAFTTSFNVGLSGAAKLVYSLAREGALDRRLARLSLPALVPARAMWCIAGFVAVLIPCFFVDAIFEAVPRVMALNLCVVYIATLFCWLRLEQRRRQRSSGLGVPKWAVLLTTLLLVSVLLETLVTQSSGAVWLILLVEALALALVVGRVQLTGTPQGLRDETQGRPVSELRSLIERPAPGAVVEAGQNGPS